MKLFLLISLLLVAGPVYAEVTGIKLDSHQCAIDPKYPGAVLAYCQWDDRSGFVEVRIQPDPCLARMEEAMKAMNDFIVLSNNETRGEILFYVDPTVFKDRLALWEAVKKECWSKP